MTLDELKVEAEKHGYKLIKKQESVKLLPCTCGCNRRAEWVYGRQVFYSCNRCGKKSPCSNTKIGAKRAWNEMIEKEMNEVDIK